MMAGADGQFYAATSVQVLGDEIVVSCSAVPEPVAVRYAWSGNPKATIYNKEGLPAAPFRTDNFNH
jgi:sialate O-acetylesterase